MRGGGGGEKVTIRDKNIYVLHKGTQSLNEPLHNNILGEGVSCLKHVDDARRASTLKGNDGLMMWSGRE